jgi:hypothetical protein
MASRNTSRPTKPRTLSPTFSPSPSSPSPPSSPPSSPPPLTRSRRLPPHVGILNQIGNSVAQRLKSIFSPNKKANKEEEQEEETVEEEEEKEENPDSSDSSSSSSSDSSSTASDAVKRSNAYSIALQNMRLQQVRSAEYHFVDHLVFGLAYDPPTDEFTMFCNVQPEKLDKAKFKKLLSVAQCQLKSAALRKYIAIDENSSSQLIILPSLTVDNLDCPEFKSLNLTTKQTKLNTDKKVYAESADNQTISSKSLGIVRKIRDHVLKPMRFSVIPRADGNSRNSFGFSLMAGAFSDSTYLTFRYSPLVRQVYKTTPRDSTFYWDEQAEINQNMEAIKEKSDK